MRYIPDGSLGTVYDGVMCTASSSLSILDAFLRFMGPERRMV